MLIKTDGLLEWRLTVSNELVFVVQRQMQFWRMEMMKRQTFPWKCLGTTNRNTRRSLREPVMMGRRCQLYPLLLAMLICLVSIYREC